MSRKGTNYKQNRIIFQTFNMNANRYAVRKEEKKQIQSRLARLLGSIFKKK